MTTKITINDIISKTADDIIDSMMTIEEVEKPKELVIDKSQIKEKLENYFRGRENIMIKDRFFEIDDTIVKITQVNKYSARTHFIIEKTKEKFSLPFAYLTGKAEPLGFEKGETVVFRGKSYVIENINPSNRTVRLDIDGKLTNINVRNISKPGFWKKLVG